jgi:hypothetical protein
MPVSRGNLRSLEAAVAARERGVPVVILRGGDTVPGRSDHTGGEAGALLERLLSRGAEVVSSVDGVIGTLREGSKAGDLAVRRG